MQPVLNATLFYIHNVQVQFIMLVTRNWLLVYRQPVGVSPEIGKEDFWCSLLSLMKWNFYFKYCNIVAIYGMVVLSLTAKGESEIGTPLSKQGGGEGVEFLDTL